MVGRAFVGMSLTRLRKGKKGPKTGSERNLFLGVSFMIRDVLCRCTLHLQRPSPQRFICFSFLKFFLSPSFRYLFSPLFFVSFLCFVSFSFLLSFFSFRSQISFNFVCFLSSTTTTTTTTAYYRDCGVGVYLAENSSVLHLFAMDKSNADGFCYMFLCLVNTVCLHFSIACDVAFFFCGDLIAPTSHFQIGRHHWALM